MREFMKTLWRNTAGQDATEYVLLLVLIALAISGGMVLVSSGINNGFNGAAGTINGQGNS
jgi:Flp pilus assembly pilin Flp